MKINLDLIAGNALIELIRNNATFGVELSTMINYGVRCLNNTEYSLENIIEGINNIKENNYFNVINEDNQIIITIQDNISLKDLENKYRNNLPIDLLNYFSMEDNIKLLGIKNKTLEI